MTELTLRIDWSELDLFGHVNNVAFLKYVQSARVNYWEIAGIYQHFLSNRIGPMLASTECQFRQPLFYPGQVLVQSRMKYMGRSSFSIQHTLLNMANEIAASATDVMVMFDFIHKTPVPLPDWLRLQVEKLERRKIPGKPIAAG